MTVGITSMVPEAMSSSSSCDIVRVQCDAIGACVCAFSRAQTYSEKYSQRVGYLQGGGQGYR